MTHTNRLEAFLLLGRAAKLLGECEWEECTKCEHHEDNHDAVFHAYTAMKNIIDSDRGVIKEVISCSPSPEKAAAIVATQLEKTKLVRAGPWSEQKHGESSPSFRARTARSLEECKQHVISMAHDLNRNVDGWAENPIKMIDELISIVDKAH